MDRDSAIDLLLQRLQRVGDTDVQARILSEMQYVQDYVLEGGEFLPWFLLSENLSVNTTASEERITLPTNFLREYEGGALWVFDPSESQYIELKKDDYDFLLNRYPTELEIPKAYALDGFYFRLKPTPDIVYTLRIKCFLKDTVLTSNIENNWLKYAGDWLMAETGARVASFHIRNSKLADEFKSEAATAKNRVFVFNEARKHANRRYVMGGEDG